MSDVGVLCLEMTYDRSRRHVFTRFASDALCKARIRLHGMKRDTDNSAYEFDALNHSV